MALKLFVDPGHGRNDPGASVNGVREKDIVLAIARKVAEHLRRCGAEVRLSRTGDVTKSLQARTDEANAWGANAHVSIQAMRPYQLRPAVGRSGTLSTRNGR